MMKERPILFNAEMVRAILDGRKKMTRRPIKVVCDDIIDIVHSGFEDVWLGYVDRKCGQDCEIKCPFGQVGDRLWVRETFQLIEGLNETFDVVPKAGGAALRELSLHKHPQAYDKCDVGRWTPSIHMPRWASRITLEITGIRIERVQDITEEDAEEEGSDSIVIPSPHYLGVTWVPSFVEGFSQLWDSIYTNWDADPWVWVVEFKQVTK